MSFVTVATTWLALNAMVAMAYVALELLARFDRLSSRQTLRLHYTAFVLITVISCALPFAPKHEIFSPPMKVWAAPNYKSHLAQANEAGYLAIPAVAAPPVNTNTLSLIFQLATAVMFAVGAVRLARDFARMIRLRSRAVLVRKIQSVSIFVSEDIRVPFSHWWPGHHEVVVPHGLLAKNSSYAMVIVHELQHHRQGDTKWLYAMQLLSALAWPNPLVHAWSNRLSEIQEFACDETLVDREKVESREYASCLVEVAQTAKGIENYPVCAAGLVFKSDRKLLKRRIEKMLNPNRKMGMYGSRIAHVATIAIALVLGGAALASQNLVQDRRVSMIEAKRWQMNARANTAGDFPVVLNEQVLKQLNRFVGTPEGREYMRNALARMESYRTILEQKFAEYQAPQELMAMPLIESAYKNLSEDESHTPMRAAGLWQFVPETARHFGLRVDSQKDDRLDAALETDAGLRLLEADRLRFRDWQLSILAFNAGENKVQHGIDATGSRDAWALIKAGHEGDKDYLAKVMAAILIMRNPESVAP